VHIALNDSVAMEVGSMRHMGGHIWTDRKMLTEIMQKPPLLDESVSEKATETHGSHLDSLCEEKHHCYRTVGL